MQIATSFYEQQNEILRNSLFTHSYGGKSGIEKRKQSEVSGTALSADWGCITPC
jgi:hypothetical protein